MPSELPPNEFQNQVLSELRQANTRFDKLETAVKRVEIDIKKLEADGKALKVALPIRGIGMGW